LKLPFAHLTFKHEAHGFDRSETIESALKAEEYFYAAVLGIPSDDEIPPIEIKHL
jgi:hypothetical protein